MGDSNSLENIDPGASGLRNLDSREHFKKLKEYQVLSKKDASTDHYIKYLGLFLNKNYQKLLDEFNEDPSLVSSYENKSLKIMSMALLGKTINKVDFKVSVLPKPIEIESRLFLGQAKVFVELYIDFKKNISDLDLAKIDIWKISKYNPGLGVYFSQYFLYENIKTEFENVFKFLIDLDYGSIEFKAWKRFLLALYYRRNNEPDKAEQEYLNYLKENPIDETRNYHIKHLGIKEFYMPQDVLNNWASVLKEYDANQNEAELRAGLAPNTCDYFSCSDCCSYTFPLMSKTEFLHLKKWMQENDYPIEEIIEKSKLIQKQHKEIFGEELPIVDKSKDEFKERGAENPNDFKYDCPFLSKEGRCTCYEARPILCRGYGSSSDNDFAVKACNYYRVQYQAKANPDNDRWVVDLREIQMLARSSDFYLSKDSEQSGQFKEPKATIPAWFSGLISGESQ